MHLHGRELKKLFRLDLRRTICAHRTYLWRTSVLVLNKLFPELLHCGNARSKTSTSLDLIDIAIEPETIFDERGVCARGGGRAEVVLVESDREGRVGGEDKFLVTFPPVPEGDAIRKRRDEIKARRISLLDDCDVDRSGCGSLEDGHGDGGR